MTLRLSSVFDDLPWRNQTDAIRRRMENPRPIFDAFVDDFYEQQREMFRTRGKGRWRKNSPAWVRKKQQMGRGDRVMVYTGKLERSLTHRGAPYGVLEYGRDSVTVGSSDPVARLHNDGRARGRRKRVLIRYSPQAKREAAENALTYLTTGQVRRRSGA